MREDFEKINDYTLQQTVTLDSYSASYSTAKFELRRIFNFEAGQVTTIARDWAHQTRGSESGGSSASALQMQVQDFADLNNTAELERMHKKLQELRGNPPALDAVLTTQGKARTLGRS